MSKKLKISLITILFVAGISFSAGRLPKKGLNSIDAVQKTEKQDIDTRNANEIIKSTAAVISETDKKEIIVTFVELGSVRCIPCKMMQPVMDEIEKEYAEQVKVVFHDVWTPEGQPYAENFGIQGIPTQIFLDKEGKEFHRHTGYYPKEEIIKVLKNQGVE
ncbi:MAG: thioredoxin family protein [Elusimicrobia bacterium]|nr:thioredoxin family protein [Elusimicrobiota bacterium]